MVKSLVYWGRELRVRCISWVLRDWYRRGVADGKAGQRSDDARTWDGWTAIAYLAGWADGWASTHPVDES